MHASWCDLQETRTERHKKEGWELTKNVNKMKASAEVVKNRKTLRENGIYDEEDRFRKLSEEKRDKTRSK